MTFQEIIRAEGWPMVSSGHHHCRPGWVQIDCPYCGKGSGKYHMGYSIEGRYVACWRCGGHRLLDTIMEITGLSYPEARKMLDQAENGPTSAKEARRRGVLKLPAPRGPLAKAHASYLGGRGFIPDRLAQRWGLEGIGPIGGVRLENGSFLNLSWRIFIPVHLRGEVVSWTSRSISPSSNLRYVSAPAECEAESAKTLLYGEDFARHAICVVEGPTDVWRIGPGAVGTLGMGFSLAQVRRMSRFLVRGIWFDDEPQAQRRAQKLADMLSGFPGETIIFKPEGSKDAATASKEDVKLVRETLGL